MPLALERGHDPHLLICRDAREQNLTLVERELELRVRQTLKLRARNYGHRCRFHETDLARDRERGTRMIASDHDNFDSGFVTVCDRRRDLCPRRVFEADESVQHEVVFESFTRATVGHAPMRE